MESKNLSKTRLFSVTIKDCKVSTFTVGGHGGAGKDTSNSGVRITHQASGASGKATESRSQAKNKEVAFGRMARSLAFQTWLKLAVAQLQAGRSIDEIIAEQMQPKHLRIEIRTEKGWVPDGQEGE